MQESSPVPLERAQVMPVFLDSNLEKPGRSGRGIFGESPGPSDAGPEVGPGDRRTKECGGGIENCGKMQPDRGGLPRRRVAGHQPAGFAAGAFLPAGSRWTRAAGALSPGALAARHGAAPGLQRNPRSALHQEYQEEQCGEESNHGGIPPYRARTGLRAETLDSRGIGTG
jgi:hypothetical protein